ncbi:MAG TPA: hypothetical protein VKC34_16825, partial [Blastocatellia bacterium]|nr:hypothetical protein [Blastocatellia bacterium]
MISLLPLRNGNASASPSSQGQQPSASDLWERVDAAELSGNPAKSRSLPGAFTASRLNRDALSRLLGDAPMEFTDAARDNRVILTVPMPGGTFARFRIEESPIMEPGLAAQFPEIKTYRGQGLDDPTATARFDLTPKGFHGYILSSGDAVYTDPVSQDGAETYITYDKRELPTEAREFECMVTDADIVTRPSSPDVTPDVTSGTTLRTYRLAL